MLPTSELLWQLSLKILKQIFRYAYGHHPQDSGKSAAPFCNSLRNLWQFLEEALFDQ